MQAAPARHTAAIVIAKVGAIELPQKGWPELVSTLLSNMGQSNNNLKQATLQALGYVCEEMGKLDEDILDQQQINNILTAVAQGMRPDEADAGVRLAATVALNNALEFAHTNFDNPDERNYIMQCICEGAISPDSRLQEAAFECLVKVAGSYYEKLPMYIQDIFKLSHKAITQGDEEDVAKQAIEFWCTVAEEEIEAQEVCVASATCCHTRYIAGHDLQHCYLTASMTSFCYQASLLPQTCHLQHVLYLTVLVLRA